MVALFTALLAPLFVDWSAWRLEFEREASRIVGQPVKVAGEPRVRILPLPSLTFTELSVGSYPDGSPMMTVGSFAMNVELMPFLTGEVRIVDMLLDRPHANIHVNENGAIDWTMRKQIAVDPDKVKIDKLVVRNASVSVTGLAGGRAIEAKVVSADISAQGLTGPWRIDARGLVDGAPAELSISTGRLQETGALRVKAVARWVDRPYRLTADGAVALEGDLLGWRGDFEIAAIAGEDEGERAPAPLPVFVAGTFEATPRAIVSPEYRAEIGPREDPYTITGKAEAALADRVLFRIEADGRQIDLDQLPARASGNAGPAGLDARIASLRALIDRIPVPDATGVIDFRLPAIVAGDTVIREVKAVVRPEGDAWRFDRLEAIVPGNTRVEAAGTLATGRDFGFSGSLLVASRQPTGLANWLSGGANEQLRRLSAAGLQAKVVLTQSQATFEDMELVLDGAVLSGRLQRIGAAAGRPAIIAELKGDLVDLDNLVAIYAMAQGREGAGLTGHDLDITLNAGKVRADGVEAEGVDARIKVEAGAIAIERLNAANFHGAAIRSEGRLGDMLDRASGSLKLKVVASDASGLAALAAQRLGANAFFDAYARDPELSAGLDLDIAIDARPEGAGALGSVEISGRAGGARILARNRFEGAPGDWANGRHDLAVKIEQEDAALLARQLILPVLPVEAPGPVVIDAEFSGVPLATMNASVAVRAEETDASAIGSIGFARAVGGAGPDFARPTMSFEVTAGARDIDPWLMLAGYPLPGAGQGNPASFAFTLNGGEGRYRFADIAGQYAGEPFSGEATLSVAGPARPKLEGALDFGLVSAPFLAEMAAGAGTFAMPSGLQGQDAPEFGAALLAGLDAEIAVTAQRLDLGAVGEATDLSGRLTVADGAIAAPQFTASLLSGRLSGGASIAVADGNATVNVQAKLDGLSLDQAVELAGFAPFLGGEASLGLSLEAVGRSRDALLADLTGSGVVRLGKAQLRGVGTGGLAAILQAGDAEGFQIGRDSVLALARQTALGGQMEIGELEAAFSLAQGRIVARNLRFADAGGSVEAEASASLVTGVAQARLDLSYDPGDDALSGAEPQLTLLLEGKPDAVALDIDTTALEGFLSLRAFEREQRRVAIIEASVLEKQRLRREVTATNARIALRERQRQDELRRLEELQRQLAEEAARKAAEEAARQAEEAARKAAEEAARKAAEEAARSPGEKAAREAIVRTEPPAPAAQSAPGGGGIFLNLEKKFAN